MSFEISIHQETRQLHSVDDVFVDDTDCRYSGFFDGGHVVFRSGDVEFVGRWIQGTKAVSVSGGGRLSAEFELTFMDHGPRPQRLHAVWKFAGPLEQAIAGWERAGFTISRADRRWNRNHPAAIHLRTRGNFASGADSSHVIIPTAQSGTTTRGDVHVGEFNPLTGFGLGFALHQLEPWISKRA
jgi:hypothetical protein